MNETEILLEQLKFNRSRTLGFLTQLEESPECENALSWRMPFGKGRAHIAWQFLHLAATYHKFAHFVDPVANPLNQEFIDDFGHGSKPDEKKKYTTKQLRELLNQNSKSFESAILNIPVETLGNKPETTNRTYREILHLMNWHEVVHIGQSQITWNAFRASKGIID